LAIAERTASGESKRMSPLNILLVEDNPDDELLIRRELKKAGIHAETVRVDTVNSLREALVDDRFQLVISDYCLPTLDGLIALHECRKSRPELPFILISGTVGEEIAVEAIKAGADDYLLKQNLIRLGPAVNRAIREAEEKRRREVAERALFDSRGRLELIYNTVTDFLVFISLGPTGEWHYRSVNRAFVTKLVEVGLSVLPEEVLDLPCLEVERDRFCLDAATVAWFNDQREHASQGKTITVERELELPRGKFTGEFCYNPISDPDGGIRRILIQGRDLTSIRQQEAREKQIQQQLLQASKMEALGTLSGGIAHDFNNLLTGILGYAELSLTANDFQTLHTNAAQIIRVASRAKELTRQILSFARPQSAIHEPIFITPIIEEILPLLRTSFLRTIRVRVDFPEISPIIFADASQLHQVILNLCTNAAHAMPHGGDLTLRIAEVDLDPGFCEVHRPLKPGRHARLTIMDTGEGIPPESLPRIFEPFFTTKAIGHGTGLGLAMVHGIIANHRGAITVDSDVGVGTNFHVYLPVADDNPKKREQLTVDLVDHLEHVLCLDDDPMIADLTAKILEQLRYRSTPFTEPQLALTAFDQRPEEFDVIVTDYKMPGQNGVQVIEAFRKLRTKIPAILLTGLSELSVLEKAQLLGHVVILQKPFTRDELQQALTRALQLV
jgi:signal transduction histidine kinase/DNA-binding response OmpR family regulator